jgi:hypothetical protein
MDPALRALCRQSITHDAFSALADQAGDTITYGTATTFRARVTPTSELVVTGTGREVVASWLVWFDPGDTTLDSRDRITLPDGSTPRILKMDIPVDENGQIYHAKLYLGYTS